MAKKGVLLTDKDENFLYPQTILEMVTNKEQTATLDVLLQVLRENLESSIENTNLNVSNLRDELNALLTDETLSGEVRDAILELNSLLNSGSSDITSEVLTSIRQLKEDAVLHSEQSLTSSQKQQARNNVDAVGVVTTYGDGGSWVTLSYDDKTIYPETKGSQVKLSGGRNAEDAINQNSGNIVKEKERAQQTEMYLESQKANKYGYYENLSVGVADNLSGRGEATESEFSFRPSGGENKSIEDGTARINSIKGNSVVYNQLVKPYHIKTTLSPATSFNLNEIKFEYGHKYLFLKTQSFHKDVYFQSDGTIGLCRLRGSVNSNIMEMTSTIEVKSVAFIYNAGAEDVEIDTYIKVVDLTKMFNGVNVPTTAEEFEALYGNMPDEYNEGTIIDNHTTAIKSVGVNAWDEEWEVGLLANSTGQLVNTGFGRASKNFTRVISGQSYRADYKDNNIISPTHLYFYKQDKSYIGVEYNIESGKNIIIPSDCEFVKFGFGDNAHPFTGVPEVSFHLVHTGYLNGKYFPYESQIRQLPTVEGGLKSAGTAYDEIRYNKSKDKWEYIQRVGVIEDLSKLTWATVYTATGGGSDNCIISNDIKGVIQPNNGAENRLLCPKYIAINNAYSVYIGNYTGISSNEIGSIYFTDLSVENPTLETLVAKLQGVILYYGLATPVVTELDVDISPDYKVWDYGTEEAISEVLSTPVRINANYGFNAVGQITDNTELIKELLARVSALEAQLAQQTNAIALAQDVDE